MRDGTMSVKNCLAEICRWLVDAAATAKAAVVCAENGSEREALRIAKDLDELLTKRRRSTEPSAWRTNAVYRRFAPDVEIYSIDESFLDLSDVRPSVRVELARDLRSTVRTWTGIPTCVGIGPTKTLAKLANHLAKTHAHLKGVCDLSDPTERARWMAVTKLEEIWGVGAASARKLRALGCDTVANVAAVDPRTARKALTIVGERLIYELRGMPCVDLETAAPTRKGCAVTRSFSRRIDDLNTMQQAVAAPASRLGEKLRREALGTDHVTVFFHTSDHDDGPQRSISTVVRLPEATSDTMILERFPLRLHRTLRL